MILFRCISGIFSGSGVTIRTMVSEGSAPGAQARGFSLLAFASSVSILIAPLIGGGLAKPAEVYPIFRDVKLFVVYPYLLPCLVVGVISFLSGVATSLWLKEVSRPLSLSVEPLTETSSLCRPSSLGLQTLPKKSPYRPLSSSSRPVSLKYSASTCSPSPSCFHIRPFLPCSGSAPSISVDSRSRRSRSASWRHSVDWARRSSRSSSFRLSMLALAGRAYCGSQP